MARSTGPTIRHYWSKASALPGGKWLFSRLLGIVVPYTGTLGARIEVLEPGFCRVKLTDRRRVRNHLHSIHAVALCNLGEMATGLALLNSLPQGARGILTGISVDYLKKGRGCLYASCRCAVPEHCEEQTHVLTGVITDARGDRVAEVEAHWLTGPEKAIASGD